MKLQTPAEVARELGLRVRELRLARNWRRATLAERAGVGLSTIARFETSGRATMANLLAIADALGRLDELAQLFRPPPARSLAELERDQPKRPKRGRR
jgi:transcriptional regulator with XRE-family HTH domain